MDHGPAPLRVLLCDDSALSRRLVRHVLEDAGELEVVGEAADGVEAVELAATLCPDVVVLDLQMPRMTGLEALPRLRQTCPGVRVVVHSSDPVQTRAALRGGASAAIPKGAAADEILGAVTAAALTTTG